MKNKKTPMRRCVGCMASKPKSDMVRITCYEGKVTVDFTGKAKGRGIYICSDADCIEKAKKKRSLQRSFEADLTEENIEEVFRELSEHEQKDN